MGLILFSLRVTLAASVFALLLGWLWVSGYPSAAVIVCLAWLFASTPWVIFTVGLVVDLFILGFTGRVLVMPLIGRMAVEADKARLLTKRPAPRRDWRRVAISVTAFTNPLMPLIFATAAFVDRQPAMDKVIDSLIDEIGRGRRRNVVAGLSRDWEDHLRMRGQPA